MVHTIERTSSILLFLVSHPEIREKLDVIGVYEDLINAGFYSGRKSQDQIATVRTYIKYAREICNFLYPERGNFLPGKKK